MTSIEQCIQRLREISFADDDTTDGLILLQAARLIEAGQLKRKRFVEFLVKHGLKDEFFESDYYAWGSDDEKTS